MARMIDAAEPALVRAYEGLRLEAYRDGAGIWIIGYGHTQGVRPGDAISAERAEQLLEADMMVAEAVVSVAAGQGATDRRSVRCPGEFCFQRRRGRLRAKHAAAEAERGRLWPGAGLPEVLDFCRW